MFEYFYHEILRKTVISFGTLFNDINIKKTDSSDNVTSVVKVPLAYGPMQKFLARLEQSEDLNKATQITLPRMSFEMTGISYDSARKVTTTQTFLAGTKDDGTDIRKNYMPVPYNVDFELSIYTKINDEMLLGKIKKSKPNVIFIQIGGGIQESLGFFLKQKLNYNPSIICTGAALAFLSGEQAKIPKWADRFYLGWFIRCLKSPKVFVPRYFKAIRLAYLLLRFGSEFPSK